MPKYVLMTRLSPDLFQDPRGRRKLGKEFLERVEKLCPEVKWIAHYALLGPYDFMDVYEAPGDLVAHRVSLISRSSGAKSAESWPAVEYREFLDVVAEVEDELLPNR